MTDMTWIVSPTSEDDVNPYRTSWRVFGPYTTTFRGRTYYTWRTYTPYNHTHKLADKFRQGDFCRTGRENTRGAAVTAARDAAKDASDFFNETGKYANRPKACAAEGTEP